MEFNNAEHFTYVKYFANTNKLILSVAPYVRDNYLRLTEGDITKG